MRPDDLTPQPLKMTEKERQAVTCLYCGASKIHAYDYRGEIFCGNCHRPWKSVEDSRRERQNK